MDQEEERVMYLSRIGREKIIKYGTYNVAVERPITQDHPFYVKREDPGPVGYIPAQAANAAPAAEPASAPEPAAESVSEDPEALVGQIISSNFKVGLSQEEVDALLNGMN